VSLGHILAHLGMIARPFWLRLAGGTGGISLWRDIVSPLKRANPFKSDKFRRGSPDCGGIRRRTAPTCVPRQPR
jgi:hypothetical protein